MAGTKQSNNIRNQTKLPSFFHSSSSISQGESIISSLPLTKKHESFTSRQIQNSGKEEGKMITLASPSSTSSKHLLVVGKKRKGSNSSQSSSCSGFQQCIICNKYFPKHNLLQHASQCDGAADIKDITRSTEKVANKEGKEREDVLSKKNDCSIQCCTYKMIDCHQKEVIKLECKAIKSSSDERINISTCDTAKKKIKTNKNENKMSSKESWKAIFVHNTSPTQSKGIIPKNHIQPTSEPIPGLFIYENFITEQEEHQIMNYLDNQTQWKHATFNGKHMGQRWGVHCNLRDRRVYPQETELPSFITHCIIPKLRLLHCMTNCIPNEANAIDYYRRKGHYLKSHVDDRQLSKEAIVNLSLAGDCNMTFRLVERKNKSITRYGTNYHDLPDEIKVMLPRRTLQVLTKCARYDYSHGISNSDLLSDRRISITMRQSPLTTSQRESAFKKKMNM